MKKTIISVCIVLFLFIVVSPGFSLTPQPPKSQKIERFTGRVTSVNLEDAAIVVQSMKTGMTFDVERRKTQRIQGDCEYKEGDRVTVQYVMHEGKATARTLTRNKSYH